MRGRPPIMQRTIGQSENHAREKPSLGSRTRGCAAPRLLQHRRRPPRASQGSDVALPHSLYHPHFPTPSGSHRGRLGTAGASNEFQRVRAKCPSGLENTLAARGAPIRRTRAPEASAPGDEADRDHAPETWREHRAARWGASFSDPGSTSQEARWGPLGRHAYCQLKGTQNHL